MGFIIDPKTLTPDEIEAAEKSSLRLTFQAARQFAEDAFQIFSQSPDDQQQIAEDVTREMMDDLQGFPIKERLHGTMDYKRLRFLPSPSGLVPQAFLVDSKAMGTNEGRVDLQMSQVMMPVRFRLADQVMEYKPKLPQWFRYRDGLARRDALTTSLFAHYWYTGPDGQLDDDAAAAVTGAEGKGPQVRRLHEMKLIALPHAALASRYCPSEDDHFWGKGKESTGRQEKVRVRVYLERLEKKASWRLQKLRFSEDGKPEGDWRD